MEPVFVLLSVVVVMVSSCPDGGFTCSSGDCISAGLMRDFKDCLDGTDEQFCGSCDFERHSCGWNDTSEYLRYRWIRQLANISSIPGVDHTTGSPAGHVMHLNGTQGGFSSKATLEYSVHSPAALGCQISFWYHIYDGEPQSTSSSTLKVQMVRGTTEEDLLGIKRGNMSDWENATAFIGNRPGGYKLVFFFSPPPGGKLDVMLDDIRFENCAEGETPVGSDQLSCDFENDTCSWYHDYNSSLLWKKEKTDIPAANGSYMVVSTKSADASKAARLISYPLPEGRVVCVSFYYHMYGNSIGSLKFISKRSGEEETVVWMRSGTQGKKWRFADLTFESGKPVQFIIEAVAGSREGSIAIDDITVFSSETGSCPPERECTFQGSLCGLLAQTSADFSWSRITGTSQPANSSGPASDHTLGTEQGFYLSAQLWSHPLGSRGAMITAALEPTPSDGECLMFWYYMDGSEVGELNIYLETSGNFRRTPTRLWSRSGDQGKHWRHGRVTLLSVDRPYQVIFEAVVGKGLRRDVAIDDLTVMNGACPPSGFCDFEMDLCGWVNSPPAGSGVGWDWLTGGGPLIPDRDHTTNTHLGHFAFFMAAEDNKDETARLESEMMGPTDRACLELWHITSGWLDGGSLRSPFIVFVNETTGLRPVGTINGTMNKKWIKDRVDYNSSTRHQIILQARSNTTMESFALDDIHIMRGRSCEEIIPTTTPTPTTTTPAPPSTLDCTFEQGLCSWVQEVSDDLNWTLSRGLQVDQPWTGPQYDHTVGNNQGFFIVLSGSGSKDEETATVSVPVTGLRTSQICVGFWYYMLGPSVSSLDLLVQTNSSKVLIWTRQGTQTPEWINGQVTVNMEDTTKLMFSSHRSTNSLGFIALDDVTVREGACSDHNVCGFQSGWCGFENDFSHKGHWGRIRGEENHRDHTYGTEQGFYLTVLTIDHLQTEVAQLLSPEFTSGKEMCVRFWYWLPAGPSNGLSVHVWRNGEMEDARWQRNEAPSSGWEVAEITVSSPAKFRVGFRAMHIPGMNSSVKLDEISVSEGQCSPTASCDFESGQCTWVNMPITDGHDWVLARGGFQGSLTDHTTQTPQGMFLLSSSLHQSRSSRAQVSSGWIHMQETPSCLTLWYQMNSSDSGTMKVYKQSGLSVDELIFNSSTSGNSWTRISQSLETSKPFQLLIEADTNNRGFIAIDDITVTSGQCQANETILGFHACHFENGTCGWDAVSGGQIQWLRGSNATGEYGPSVDNTLGTGLGWYMAVKQDTGDLLRPAALHSPTMTQASTTCTLRFYYNMFGEDNEELDVLLKVSSRTTTLWRLTGNHGDVWHSGEVTVGRVPQDFTILFEASRSFTQRGHVAIDDIDFSNCTLPEPLDQCPEDNMFKCNNRVCVEQSRVCDFSDDCGDRSDEQDCEQRGVLEHCSFEQGLCSWAGSNVDSSGDEWTRHSGQEAWPMHGPHRDHTRNSAAGHFVTPGAHLTEKGQTSEILSRTLLPSTNCTVRFFYFSLDDAAAQLTAGSRTLRSGSDDSVLWVREDSQGYSWRRAEATFTSSVSTKVVFRYERGSGTRGLAALDDISFSKECVLDPDNTELPVTPPTSAPPTPTTTAPPSPTTTALPTPTTTALPTPSTTAPPTSPCQDNEFFCWRSAGEVCIVATLRCDYHSDCPHGEDEDGCGPCTFESDQCQWTDTSEGQSSWRRQKASNSTEPPTDHTTHTGYYMSLNLSQSSSQTEARLQSPPLSPSSHYCQIQFHFHISAASTGSLRVLMQQADGSEAILWSRSHNTVSQWTAERLPLGLHTDIYKVWLSGMKEVTQTAGDVVVAVDDISFVNCEKSYKPPALSSSGCSFEEGLCGWVQGAKDELDWITRSGPTETPNTGPAGDHTTGKGKYLYIESSPPSEKGNVAQLKSSLLPPAGENGYCFTFWHHMFGATVGSLRVTLQTAGAVNKTLVWQKSGNQGDEWRPVQIHVTLQYVHQVILEATVQGEAGDIAIDDISFISGPCPASDVCDFEEGSCGWQQETTDDFDWIRKSGSTLNPNTGPDSDHTTRTPTGHYYYLPSSSDDREGQTAKMSSPLYPSSEGACVQLWYHMYGRGMGTLNVYQREEGRDTLLFSQTGDQGRLWRFAQASLLPRDQPYRVVVEGVKAGPTHEGDMAFDDVTLTDAQCPRHGHCDFEINMCGWSNLRGEGGVGQGEWLRGRGDSPNPNTGPSVDHTTNSTHGYYLYVDSSMGEWGDMSFLASDVLQPSTRGHCLTFWYHMYGSHVGTLRVFINDRHMHTGGYEEGSLKWIETGNKGDKWQEARVTIKHKEAFWFVFVYQRGMNTGGDVALDDITITPGGCFSDPPPLSHDDGNVSLTVGLAVGLTLLVGVVIGVFLFMLNRRRCTMSETSIITGDTDDGNYAFHLESKTDGTHRGPDADFSFYNNMYDPSPQATDLNSSDA